jgi:DNA primase
MNIVNYQQAVEALYLHLEEYLQSFGINTSHNFKCLNPKHEDSSPSMGLAPSKKVVHCFGCGISGGIFNVAHWLENKPIASEGFVQENLLYLAKKFNVEVETEPLTEEKAYELDTYRAYRVASELIRNGKKNNKLFDDAIKERGWSPEICYDYGVGCISTHKEFKESLKAAGFTASFLGDIDLDRKDIFGEDRLIFTITDDHGRPVGFASRNLSFTEDKENGSKYVNQRGTGIKVNIYRKSERLFGLDKFLKERADKDTELYIFEGYSDVVTAAYNGIRNVCAIGGTSLSIEHVNLLKRRGCYNIILCLDGDTAGQDRTAELLDTILGSHKDLKISVMTIPDDMDPDDFIRAKGKEAFLKLKKWTAFEWRLNRFGDDIEPETICKAMIPLIVNEPSYVAQEKMTATLAKATGVTVSTIRQEVNRLQNIREAELSRDRQAIIDKLLNDVKKSPSEAEFSLHEAAHSLYELTKRYELDSMSEDACLAFINQQKEFEEKKDGLFTGFHLGEDLKNLQDALAGNWKKGVWFCLGGKPNCGKTSFLAKLLFSIAENKENNACVIYHSIDDSFEQVLPKFVCVAEGSKTLTLNQVIDPNYHIKFGKGQNLQKKRSTGYAQLQDLIRTGHLVIKDANDGASLAYADMIIRYFKEKYPDRNIVYVLDNFHKLSDLSGMKDERVRFKEMSKMAKGLATQHHICVITTIEYKKIEHGKEANNSDIGETGQIEYDANIIAHVHNELHEEGEKALHYHEHDFGNGEGTKRLPRIAVHIAKNKVTGFKNKLWFDFYPDASDFTYVPQEKAWADYNAHKNEHLSENDEVRELYEKFLAEAEEKGRKEAWIMYQLKDTLNITDHEAWGYINLFKAEARRKGLKSFKKPTAESN